MEIIKINTQDGLGIIDVVVGSIIEANRLLQYLRDADIALDPESDRRREEFHNLNVAETDDSILDDI